MSSVISSSSSSWRRTGCRVTTSEALVMFSRVSISASIWPSLLFQVTWVVTMTQSSSKVTEAKSGKIMSFDLQIREMHQWKQHWSPNYGLVSGFLNTIYNWEFLFKGRPNCINGSIPCLNQIHTRVRYVWRSRNWRRICNSFLQPPHLPSSWTLYNPRVQLSASVETSWTDLRRCRQEAASSPLVIAGTKFNRKYALE